MRKFKQIISLGIAATAVVTPNIVLASNLISNFDIDIKIEKRSVILDETSNISIKIKELENVNSIDVNYVCYDETLSTNLKYNKETNSYEGIMNFDIDPEFSNVWKLDNIVINKGEKKELIDKNELHRLGMDLSEYNITQEYIISDVQSAQKYMQKTSAPIIELAGSTVYDTAVKISKEGWKNSSKKVVIVNGDIIADGISATPLAATYDSPILIVKKDSIPSVIKDEIKRLNPEEIIIVGGEYTINNNVQNELKSINNAKINRIWGQDRNQTSLKIAQAINEHHDVDKVYMANGFQGDIDALTIAAKAGQDKQPIILTEKFNVPDDSYNWLKTESLKDIYFIGGPGTLDTSIIHKMSNIVAKPPSGSVYNNRIYGEDRHETNAKVMEKFYTQSELQSVVVARSDELTDALVAGPLAAKYNSPILITSPNYLSQYHNDNLEKKSADKIYQVGNKFKDGIIKEIAYKLSLHNAGSKTVVIDPGHGGADSGALNKVNPSIKEKDYTLDTSLAATQYLRQKGINVVLTRETDLPSNKKLSLAERTSMSNAINPDLLVSVHFNSYNEKAKGLEVFYKNSDKNGGISKTLANNILNSILGQFNLTNRGIKTKLTDNGQDYYHMIRESKSPSVIVECSFIDNEQDQLLVNTLEKRNKLGNQIGKGIENTLK